jgi:hypothetical protein
VFTFDRNAQRSDEWHCYLDLRTGEVHQGPAYGREAEEHELSPDAVDEALAEGHLVPVEPLPSSVEYGWMAEFAASVADAQLRELLDVALGGPGAFRRFKDVLAGDPAERERWFAFRDQRVREAMIEWLEDHDIEPTTTPPERRGG